MIEVTCENCGKHLRVKDEFAGKKGKCPGCQTLLTVPEYYTLDLPPIPVPM